MKAPLAAVERRLPLTQICREKFFLLSAFCIPGTDRCNPQVQLPHLSPDELVWDGGLGWSPIFLTDRAISEKELTFYT